MLSLLIIAIAGSIFALIIIAHTYHELVHARDAELTRYKRLRQHEELVRFCHAHRAH